MIQRFLNCKRCKVREWFTYNAFHRYYVCTVCFSIIWENPEDRKKAKKKKAR